MCNELLALSLWKKILVFEFASIKNEFFLLPQKSKIKKKSKTEEQNEMRLTLVYVRTNAFRDV